MLLLLPIMLGQTSSLASTFCQANLKLAASVGIGAGAGVGIGFGIGDGILLLLFLFIAGNADVIDIRRSHCEAIAPAKDARGSEHPRPDGTE